MSGITKMEEGTFLMLFNRSGYVLNFRQMILIYLRQTV